MIRFDNVTKIYKGETRAVNGVTLNISKGEFVFLVGPSGSGKSTMLRLMTCEEKVTAGSIHVAGKDLSRLNSWRVPYLRRNIGSVFQDFKLLPNKTVYQNVAFALEVIGRPENVIRTQVPAILELVGLEDKHRRFPDELSGGEQQRVSVARAFVNRPLILLADEPTGNLDPDTSAELTSLLDRINRTGTTVVMATHDRTIVDSMRRRVVALRHGEMVRDEQRGGYGTDPAPSDPAPSDSVPSDPVPSDSVPSGPVTSEPVLSETVLSKTVPAEPASIQPASPAAGEQPAQ